MSLLGSIIAIAVLLTLSHLAAGWLLARWWSVRLRAEPAFAGPAASELHSAARRMADAVAGVRGDVNEHQGQLERVNQDLLALHDDDDERRSPNSVLGAVTEILQINARLHSQLLLAEKKLEEQGREIDAWMAEARTDTLTGLPNRRAFDDAVQRQIDHWRQTSQPFSVMAIDVDHFKPINDRHGHPVGDFVLSALAEVLRAVVRGSDMIARIGGEEFAAVLPGTARTGACRVAEHCSVAVASHEFHCEEMRLRVTVSIGLAVVDAGEDAASLLRRADQALYVAKSAGRDCVYLHTGNGCQRVALSRLPEDSVSTCSPTPSNESSPPSGEDTQLAAACTHLQQEMTKFLQGSD